MTDPEIPADVMAAARGVFTAALGLSSTQASTLIARAILAERQRSAAVADAMTVPLASGRPNAEAHNAACRAISRAIQGPGDARRT